MNDLWQEGDCIALPMSESKWNNHYLQFDLVKYNRRWYWRVFSAHPTHEDAGSPLDEENLPDPYLTGPYQNKQAARDSAILWLTAGVLAETFIPTRVHPSSVVVRLGVYQLMGPCPMRGAVGE